MPPPGFTAAAVEFTARISIGNGAALAVPITGAAKIGLVVFDGTAGHEISLNVSNSTFGSATVKLLQPNGTQVISAAFGTSGAFVDRTTLAQTGTYTILVDPTGTYTGTATLTLYDDTPITGAIVAGGDAVTVTTTTPGQYARLNFVLSSAFVDTRTLPATGTYTILINPGSSGTGSVTLGLYDVPPDVVESLTINGGDAVFANSTPGQNGSFTFSGTSGHHVTVRVTNNSFLSSPCVTVRLFRQDGTTQMTSSLSCSGSFNLAQQTLPAGETYIVRVDPGGANVGSLRVSVTNP